ncbi:MAG: MFS transporter [Thermoplasmatales archaeon]|nr:MFS transporter [Thermoplasmatales archaeon]
MIDITKRSYLKYFLFASLYFSEGLIWSISSVIILVFLVEEGISTSMVTLVAGIVNLPWILKFVWGPITDYFIKFGRKRFILMGGLLAAAGLFIVVFIDPLVALVPFSIILFISHVGVGFLDVSADAWAIEISREEERGKINGAMFAGLFLGFAVGALLFSFIAQTIGYKFSFLAASLLVILIIIFPLFVKEIRTTNKRQQVAKLLISEFKKKTTKLVALFSPLVHINIGILMFVLPLYMKIELQLEIAQIGLITAVFPIMMIIGSIVGGVLTDKFGRKIVISVFIGASIVFSAALIFADTWQILAVLFGIIGLLHGCYNSAIMALFMDVTNPRIGATQFSILTSLANVGEIGIGNTFSGAMISALGFTRTFLYSAWFFGPALLVLYYIRLKKTYKK